MPYIKSLDRSKLAEVTVRLRLVSLANPGELNFLFTRIAHEYLKQRGETYQSYNDIIGALEAAKLELYRRKVAPYEDEKILVNGDLP